MSQPSPQLFDLFFFEPLEGLADLENAFVASAEAYPWVKRAAGRKPQPGWLRRGLEEEADWSESFFDSLLRFGGIEQEPSFLRDLFSQTARLASLLPTRPWYGWLFEQLLERIELLSDEIDRGWLLATLAHNAARLGDMPWSASFFHELLRLARMFHVEEERARLAGQLADALGRLCTAPWCPELFESLVAMVKSLREEQSRQEAILAVSEQFFGYERLRPELAVLPQTKGLALLALSVGVTNRSEYRRAFAGRVRFMSSQLVGRYEVVPDAWEELLTTLESLRPWRHEERDLQGELRWSIEPLSALLGLLGRDIRAASNRGWAHRFFERLCQQIFQLAPGKPRELAIREVIHGLIQFYGDRDDDGEETIAWLQRLLQRADRVEREPSQIYDGVFQGFLARNDLHQANAAALRIVHPGLRDRAFARMTSAWVRRDQPQRAMVALYEIGDASLRGESALALAREECVVQDPSACAMLFQASASLPAVAQDVLRLVVSHPAFPVEAREAILQEAPEAPLSDFSRREQLTALERLRPHLANEVYTHERQSLLGLSAASEEEDSVVVVDVPHGYGDLLYLTPEEHVQTNHFGDVVAGSRISGWDDFAHMWREIRPEVERLVDPAGGVQVFELALPIDVGVIGVMPLKDAPPEHLSTEIRNGQPSLFCLAPTVRQPARSLTIVVGPSRVEAGEIEGYDGHDLPCVLYTIYPGAPAYPFPRCSQDMYRRLETSLQAVVSLIASGQFEEGKSLLFETYSRLEGSDESARFWSRHVLIL